MSFIQQSDRRITGEHSLEELKVVYRVLHRYLAKHPELMEADFLHDLQTVLQRIARSEGVDVDHHGNWDTWLGNVDAPPCEERVERRRVINPTKKS